MNVIIIIISYILLYALVMLIISQFWEELGDENIFFYLLNTFVIINFLIIIFEIPLIFSVYNAVVLTIATMYFAEVLNIRIYKYLKYLYPLLHMLFVVILTMYCGEITIIEKLLYTYKNQVSNEIYNNICIFFQLPLLQFDTLPSSVETPDFCLKPIVGTKASICYNFIGGEGKELSRVVAKTAKSFVSQNELAKHSINTLKSSLVIPVKSNPSSQILKSNIKTIVKHFYAGEEEMETLQFCLNDKGHHKELDAIRRDYFHENVYPYVKGNFESNFSRLILNFFFSNQTSCLNEALHKAKLYSYEDLKSLYPLPHDWKMGDMAKVDNWSEMLKLYNLFEFKYTGKFNNFRKIDFISDMSKLDKLLKEFKYHGGVNAFNAKTKLFVIYSGLFLNEKNLSEIEKLISLYEFTNLKDFNIDKIYEEAFNNFDKTFDSEGKVLSYYNNREKLFNLMSNFLRNNKKN